MSMFGSILTDFAITCTGKETYFSISYPAHVDASLVKANAPMDSSGAPSVMRRSVTSRYNALQITDIRRDESTSNGDAILSFVTNTSLKMPYEMKQACNIAAISRVFSVIGNTMDSGSRRTSLCITP
mmetsp:Transcript_41198/g.113645  ORF Transcript_41198/g.113645 Transcript_41198/m.113645 type:complete len:127 (+) Transcript_41198:864-1244(+)